ncbi:Glycoside hydrolase family 43 [Penicillium macrosclerotiorum]|uniref:Glycoside hydrolase family 43 n=1 Tax=Penicillium macrosclerotiorum TaxID=303699 RepID=UPI002547B511|nr:Glycoside hydrolase family 43 [Penicillium macrosclerotiorum]KAJ5668651.1 Glycoside hydrolase family 43 [Penicillium macrosclerotiorum]
MLVLLGLVSLFSFALSLSVNLHAARDALTRDDGHTSFPAPRQAWGDKAHTTRQNTHDPTILLHGDTFYLYTIDDHIAIYSAPDLAGPWEYQGSVLEADSIIEKGGTTRKRPWAPTVIQSQMNGYFYCYYSVSRTGSRDSAVGVATSATPGAGNWSDFGAVVQTGSGDGSDVAPYTRSNAIDPSIVTLNDGQDAYLLYGSYWTGIYQVRLDEVWVRPSDTKSPEFYQLAFLPNKATASIGGLNPELEATRLKGDPTGPHPIEGSYMSQNSGYYYLWFSHGTCCGFTDVKSLLTDALENAYSIRVGRSTSPHGGFVDKDGNSLLEGGGSIVYGTNTQRVNGQEYQIYAPGGQGVITVGDTDYLFYHYLNTSIGVDFQDALLGFNPLKYVDGWPEVQA